MYPRTHKIYLLLAPQIFTRPTSPINCISSRTWGTGRPQVGLCPIFLVVRAARVIVIVALCTGDRRTDARSRRWTGVGEGVHGLVQHGRFQLEIRHRRLRKSTGRLHVQITLLSTAFTGLWCLVCTVFRVCFFFGRVRYRKLRYCWAF